MVSSRIPSLSRCLGRTTILAAEETAVAPHYFAAPVAG
jgi:hypothetical protein